MENVEEIICLQIKWNSNKFAQDNILIWTPVFLDSRATCWLCDCLYLPYLFETEENKISSFSSWLQHSKS